MTANELVDLTVSTPGGGEVGVFHVRASSTVGELKMRVAEVDEAAKAHGDQAPLFQNLLLPTDDPLRPTLLEDGLSLREAGVTSGADLTLVRLPPCAPCEGKCAPPSGHLKRLSVPWISRARTDSFSGPSSSRQLPDLTQRLVDAGIYDRYVEWREGYRAWRSGAPHGAKVDLLELGKSPGADGDARFNAWRDGYRQWRQGHAKGAAGETVHATARPLKNLMAQGQMRVRTVSASWQVGGGDTPRFERGVSGSSAAPSIGSELSECSTSLPVASMAAELPAVVYDVVALEGGSPALVPTDGPPVPPIAIEDFPAEALVTIRTFRFFEDRADKEQVWEQELRNVNSGSLLWLPVHMEPGLHSKGGAKYGRWFTIHYIQIYVKHFRSAYHMANEGSCYPAKTFGATSANTSTITGKPLERGYFWYISPVSNGGEGCLAKQGWSHLCRAGPFNGMEFVEHWRSAGSPMEPRSLQAALEQATQQ